MDEDTMAVLLDPNLPNGFSMCNTDTIPGTCDTILQFY